MTKHDDLGAIAKKEKENMAQLARVFHDVPFNHMLGLKLQSLSHEEATISFSMREEHVGNFLHGILHGGVISSVLDAVGGVVAMATVIHKYPDAELDELVKLIGKCSTIDLTINYLRAGRGESFFAKAYALKSGNKVIFVRMELLNQDNELIATGSGTYFC